MPLTQSFVAFETIIPHHDALPPDDSLQTDFPLPSWMFQTSPYEELWQRGIKESVENLTVSVRLVKVGLTRTDKPYVRVIIRDRSDTMPGVLWASSKDEADAFANAATNHGILVVNGYIGEYPKDSGQRQCTIRSYQIAQENASAVLPTAWPMYDPYVELQSLVHIVHATRQPLQDAALWSIKENWPAFGLAPAALSYHHAFLGGLLVHTSQLLRLLWAVLRGSEDVKQAIAAVTWRFTKAIVAGRFLDERGSPYLSDSLNHAFQMAQSCIHMLTDDELDVDVCLLAGLYHDLGKTREYEFTKNIDMHQDGKLLGHIYTSATLATSAMETFSVPESVQLRLLHAILAHHGLLEYGSPVKPQTPEAAVLHWADYICSRCS